MHNYGLYRLSAYTLNGIELDSQKATLAKLTTDSVECIIMAIPGRVDNNNNAFCIAPQQQLYELLALYKSTNVIEHTLICYLK